jgi:hypothetical protein
MLTRPSANIAILKRKAGLTATGMASAASNTTPDATCRASPKAVTGVTARALTSMLFACRNLDVEHRDGTHQERSPQRVIQISDGIEPPDPRACSSVIIAAATRPLSISAREPGSRRDAIFRLVSAIHRLAGDDDPLNADLALLSVSMDSLRPHRGAGL